MEFFYFDIKTVGNYESLSSLREYDIDEYNFYKQNNYDEENRVVKDYPTHASLKSTYGKIVCISFGYIDNNGDKQIRSFSGNERKIIDDFNKLLIKISKKNFILCGYGILNFDIPWILHKLHKYDIEPADIILTYDKKPWDMRIKDVMLDWSGKYYVSLHEMCYELGVDFLDYDSSTTHNDYWEGRDIVESNEKDIASLIDCSIKIYNKIS